MADHMEEPPQKRVKLQSGYQQGPSDSGEWTLGGDSAAMLTRCVPPTELLSRSDIYGLEDCLPDELVSTGWEEVLGGNKPPAQGPGPGQQQMNGGDENVVGGPPNVTMQQQQQRTMQQQQMVAHHLLQQVLGSWDGNGREMN